MNIKKVSQSQSIIRVKLSGGRSSAYLVSRCPWLRNDAPVACGPKSSRDCFPLQFRRGDSNGTHVADYV